MNNIDNNTNNFDDLLQFDVDDSLNFINNNSILDDNFPQFSLMKEGPADFANSSLINTNALLLPEAPPAFNFTASPNPLSLSPNPFIVPNHVFNIPTQMPVPAYSVVSNFPGNSNASFIPNSHSSSRYSTGHYLDPTKLSPQQIHQYMEEFNSANLDGLDNLFEDKLFWKNLPALNTNHSTKLILLDCYDNQKIFLIQKLHAGKKTHYCHLIYYLNNKNTYSSVKLGEQRNQSKLKNLIPSFVQYILSLKGLPTEIPQSESDFIISADKLWQAVLTANDKVASNLREFLSSHWLTIKDLYYRQMSSTDINNQEFLKSINLLLKTNNQNNSFFKEKSYNIKHLPSPRANNGLFHRVSYGLAPTSVPPSLDLDSTPQPMVIDTITTTTLSPSILNPQAVVFAEKQKSETSIIESFVKKISQSQKNELNEALKRHTPQLLTLINKNFFEKGRQLFYQSLLEQDLFWSIELGETDLKNLINTVVKAIIKYPMFPQDKLLLLMGFVQYFNISIKEDFIPSQTFKNLKLTDHEISDFFNHFVFELRKAFPAVKRQNELVDEYVTKQASYTFMQLKQWELMLLSPLEWINNYQSTIAEKQVFLVAQDGRDIKLLPYQAYFKKDQLTEMSPQDPQKTHLCLSNYLPFLSPNNEGFEWTVSLEQFSDLKKQILENALNIPPPLIWPRKKEKWKVDLNEEQSPELSSLEDKDKPLPTEKKLKLPPKEKKRKIEEEELVNLNDFKEKQQASLEPKKTGHQSKKNKIGYEEKNFYVPLTDEEYALKKDHPMDGSSEEDGFLSNVSSKFEFETGVLQAKSLADLWNNLSDYTLKDIEQSVTQENEYFNLLKNQKPIKYKILNQLSQPDSHAPICYLPILKPYQKDVYNQFVKLENKGVSSLISMEMGTGKTFVMIARILLSIAQGKPGHKLVFVPASIKQNFYEEALRGLYEAKTTAFRNVLLSGQGSKAESLVSRNLIFTLSNFNFNDTSAHLSLKTGINMYAQAVYHNNKYRYSSSRFLRNNLGPKTVFECCLPISQLKFLATMSQNNPTLFSQIEKQFDQMLKLIPTIPKDLLNDLLYYFREKNNLNIENILDRFIEFFKKESFEYCVLFVGTILSVNTQNLEGSNNNQDSENILNFNFNQIYKALKPTDFSKQLENKEVRVLITSHDSYQKKKTENALQANKTDKLEELDLSIYEKAAIDLAFIDEGQNFHTTGTAYSCWARELSKILRSKQAMLAIVTGTPFENNYKELLNLLSIANPEGFSSKSLNALNKLYDNTISLLSAATIDENKIKESVILSFVHFAALKNLVKQLVLIKEKRSADVMNDWNHLIPLENRIVLGIDLSVKHQSTLDKIRNVEKQALKAFNFEKTMKRILIGGASNLEHLGLEKNKDLLKELEKKPKKLDEFVSQSPILDNFISNDYLAQAIQENKHILVIVENLIVGNIGALACQRKFNLKPESTQFYNGELKEEVRDQLVKWFKAPVEGESKILFLSIDAGGVGLNLQETDCLFNLCIQYNPAKEEQAIARAVRVGNAGEKDIISLFFQNTYFHQHQQIITSLKKQQAQFFFNSAPSLLQLFDVWKNILVEESTKLKLNHSKNINKAENHSRNLKDILTTLFEGLSEEDVKELVEKATYQASTNFNNHPVLDEETHAVVPQEMQSEPINTVSNQVLKFPIADFFQIPIGRSEEEAKEFAAFAYSLFSANQTQEAKKSIEGVMNFFSDSNNYQNFCEKAFEGMSSVLYRNLFYDLRNKSKKDKAFSQPQFNFQVLNFKIVDQLLELTEQPKDNSLRNLRILETTVRNKPFYSVLLKR